MPDRVVKNETINIVLRVTREEASLLRHALIKEMMKYEGYGKERPVSTLHAYYRERSEANRRMYEQVRDQIPEHPSYRNA